MDAHLNNLIRLVSSSPGSATLPVDYWKERQGRKRAALKYSPETADKSAPLNRYAACQTCCNSAKQGNPV